MKKLIIVVMLLTTHGYSIGQVDSHALAKCAAIQQNDKRLECFDQLASLKSEPERENKITSVAEKPTDGSTSTIATATVTSTASRQPLSINTDTFGKENSVLQELKKQETSITATVVKVTYGAYKKFTVTLDNGQRWKQSDSRRLRLKPNDTVIINRAALNSFLLKKQNSNSTRRVKRVD